MAAIATFCFCPPERVAISRFLRSEMPTVSSVWDTRSSIWSWGTPKFSRPKSISSSTTDATIWVSMSCSTLPTMREMSVSVTSQVSLPVHQRGAVERPAVVVGDGPGHHGGKR
jgi:hypothetical protein